MKALMVEMNGRTAENARGPWGVCAGGDACGRRGVGVMIREAR